MSNALSFADLRAANLLRLPRFRDREGNLCHSKPDGSDWTIERWMNAFYGECGEASGELKKVARGDYGRESKLCMDEGRLKGLPAEVKLKIQREFADIVTYLDLAAVQLGIDLGEAVMEKFNVVSARVNAGVEMREWSNGMGVTVYDSLMDDANIPF